MPFLPTDTASAELGLVSTPAPGAASSLTGGDAPSLAGAPTPAVSTVRLAEVLAALTYALDRTEGQRPGHTLRTCILAMRLGRAVKLPPDELEALYYAALLKDAGCSSNAARMAALFGSDDQDVKRNMRLVDWQDRWALAVRTARNCGVGRSPIARVVHFLRIARTPDMTRQIIQARCERGAAIAAQLGFPRQSSQAIANVDEQWCGLGHPVGISGIEIPLLSRILLLTQTLEVFATEQGVDAAFQMVRRRKGRWFDPMLCDEVSRWKRDADLWRQLSDAERLEDAVLALEPSAQPVYATDERLDDIAHGFAAVIDAKSPFTGRHSTNVARYAAELARQTGSSRSEVRDVLRAGLLHDLGKLGISNRILDKPAALTDDERTTMRDHPRLTRAILERVPAFARVAHSASLHHERLDGRGYPWGLGGDDLDRMARLLGVADVYEALTADRPYRAGMSADRALGIMVKDRGAFFEPALFDVADSLARDGVFKALAAAPSDPFATYWDTGALSL